jgi:hypothetical protein
MESPEISPHNYGHLIFDEGAKNTDYGQNTLEFSINRSGKTGYPHAEE